MREVEQASESESPAPEMIRFDWRLTQDLIQLAQEVIFRSRETVAESKRVVMMSTRARSRSEALRVAFHEECAAARQGFSSAELLIIGFSSSRGVSDKPPILP